jgi:hypothetical protein
MGYFIPLFTITVAGHPSYLSIVSEASLHRLGLRVPQILSPCPERESSPLYNLVFKLDHPKISRKSIDMAGADYTVVKNL